MSRSDLRRVLTKVRKRDRRDTLPSLEEVEKLLREVEVFKSYFNRTPPKEARWN